MNPVNVLLLFTYWGLCQDNHLHSLWCFVSFVSLDIRKYYAISEKTSQPGCRRSREKITAVGNITLNFSTVNILLLSFTRFFSSMHMLEYLYQIESGLQKGVHLPAPKMPTGNLPNIIFDLINDKWYCFKCWLQYIIWCYNLALFHQRNWIYSLNVSFRPKPSYCAQTFLLHEQSYCGFFLKIYSTL